MTEPTAENPIADHVGGEPGASGRPDEDRWPIGFILTIVMVGGYLAYRLVQGVVLFFDWIF